MEGTSERKQTAEITQVEPHQPVLLHLQPQRHLHVKWSANVVDNEGLGRKSSKKCCIYHKPRRFGESSSEESDSDSSTTTSSSASSGTRDLASFRGKGSLGDSESEEHASLPYAGATAGNSEVVNDVGNQIASEKASEGDSDKKDEPEAEGKN